MNKANPVTFDLLEQTLDKIANLIDNVEEVGAGQNGDAIVFTIDDTQFDVKQTIFCRLCKVRYDLFIYFFLFRFLNQTQLM